MPQAGSFAAALLAALLVAGALDYVLTCRAWRAAAPRPTRRMPDAFAIGVERRVTLELEFAGARHWRLALYDHADPSLMIQGMPRELTTTAAGTVELDDTVTPSRRGEVAFAPADIRVRSRWRLLDLLGRLGTTQHRRVYSNFAQVARYAWLAGDRRLAEIGVKAYRQRGEGTGFAQLAEYRVGDSTRHIAGARWSSCHELLRRRLR